MDIGLNRRFEDLPGEKGKEVYCRRCRCCKKLFWSAACFSYIPWLIRGGYTVLLLHFYTNEQCALYFDLLEDIPLYYYSTQCRMGYTSGLFCVTYGQSHNYGHETHKKGHRKVINMMYTAHATSRRFSSLHDQWMKNYLDQSEANSHTMRHGPSLPPFPFPFALDQ